MSTTFNLNSIWTIFSMENFPWSGSSRVSLWQHSTKLFQLTRLSLLMIIFSSKTMTSSKYSSASPFKHHLLHPRTSREIIDPASSSFTLKSDVILPWQPCRMNFHVLPWKMSRNITPPVNFSSSRESVSVKWRITAMSINILKSIQPEISIAQNVL
jgi:nitric oxide synthase oxygenase domain/subunit